MITNKADVKLSKAKTNMVKALVKEFLEECTWVENIEKVVIDTTLNDSHTTKYEIAVMQFYNATHTNYDDMDNMKDDCITFLEEIRKKVDKEFLHYKRNGGQYTLEGPNISDKLENFVLENVW